MRFQLVSRIRFVGSVSEEKDPFSNRFFRISVSFRNKPRPAFFFFLQRLFFRGGELRNPHTLQDCGIYRDGQTVYLASSPQDEMGKPYSLEPFLGAGGLPRSLSRVLGQVR